MLIERKYQTRHFLLANVEDGDVFRWDSGHYLKIGITNGWAVPEEPGFVFAVSLFDGELVRLLGSTKIEPVSGRFVED